MSAENFSMALLITSFGKKKKSLDQEARAG
jgi:hypothetical protein